MSAGLVIFLILVALIISCVFIFLVIVYLLTSHVRIVPVFVGKVSTVLQLSMVAAVLIAPDVFPVAEWWIYVMRSLWWSAAAAAVLAVLVYIRNGIGYIEQFENAQNNY